MECAIALQVDISHTRSCSKYNLDAGATLEVGCEGTSYTEEIVIAYFMMESTQYIYI